MWRLEQEGEFLDVHHRCHGAQALGGAGLQEGRVLGVGRQGLLNAKALDSPTGTGEEASMLQLQSPTAVHQDRKGEALHCRGPL